MKWRQFSHQNDSLPDGDTTPDEAQQNQGIVELSEPGFGQMIYFRVSRLKFGFSVQQFVFHRESPGPVCWSL